MIDTAKTLKRCMKTRKLTQRELSQLSGHHHRTIANVLSGRNCWFDTFDDLLNAMDYELRIVDIKAETEEEEQ